jgi:hypothetical protein
VVTTFQKNNFLPGSSDTLGTIYQMGRNHMPEDCYLKIVIESIGIFLVTPVELLCSLLMKDFQKILTRESEEGCNKGAQYVRW